METIERYFAEQERMEALSEATAPPKRPKAPRVQKEKPSSTSTDGRLRDFYGQVPEVRVSPLAEPLNEDLYVGQADAKEGEEDDVVKLFDGVAKKTLAKDATIGDLFLLHRREHWYPPRPSREQVYAAAIGTKTENLVTLDKQYPGMMMSLLYYAMWKSIESSPSYKFGQVSAEIDGRTYAWPTGDQELQPIEIGLNKTIHVPKNFHMLAKGKDDAKNVVFVLAPGYETIDLKVWGRSKAAVADFMDWFDAQVKKHNFMKGGKIDGKGRFLPIDMNMDWDDIVLPAGIREKFEREILDMFKMQHVYAANGVPPKAGFALLGPPGTGKTTLIKVLAVKLDKVTVIMITPDCVRYGTSAVRGIYELAQELAPTLVMWEDADIYLGDRHSMMSNGGILSEVMNILDGVVPLRGVVTGISTNRPEDLEAALINRPGRIDVKIYLGPPDDLGRFELLRRHLKKVHVDPKDVKKIAQDERIKDFTGCYLADLVRRAIKRAISEGRYDRSTLVADVSYEDLSYAIDDILKERKIMGDFTRSAMIIQKAGYEDECEPCDRLIEAVGSFGLSEAASAKRIRNFLKVWKGEEEIDFDAPMDKSTRAAALSLLDDPAPLRRMGVKPEAIDAARDLGEKASLGDLAMTLSGR